MITKRKKEGAKERTTQLYFFIYERAFKMCLVYYAQKLSKKTTWLVIWLCSYSIVSYREFICWNLRRAISKFEASTTVW